MMLEKLDIHMRSKGPQPIQNNLSRIIGWNIRVKLINNKATRSAGEYFCDLWIGQRILRKDPESINHKRLINWTSSKFKISIIRSTIKKKARQRGLPAQFGAVTRRLPRSQYRGLSSRPWTEALIVLKLNPTCHSEDWRSFMLQLKPSPSQIK